MSENKDGFAGMDEQVGSTCLVMNANPYQRVSGKFESREETSVTQVF